MNVQANECTVRFYFIQTWSFCSMLQNKIVSAFSQEVESPNMTPGNKEITQDLLG